MSSAAIANTLVSLLPTYTISSLPKPLQDTATALLAQSRSRAPALKAEEEPARAWACADIAVKRLQTRLNLPAVSQNPPCPPRVYKKLYQYLDRTLVTSTSSFPSSSAPVTPQKLRTTLDTPTKSPATTKDLRISQISRPLSGKRKIESDVPAPEGTSPWLASTIRHVCKKFSASAAVPHVYVGVISILRASEKHHDSVSPLSGRKSRVSATPDATTSPIRTEHSSDHHVLAVLLAVLLLVLDKMQLHPSHEDLLAKQNELVIKQRAAAQEFVALGRLGISQVGAVLTSSKQLLNQMRDAWQAMDWWESIPTTEDDYLQHDEERDNAADYIKNGDRRAMTLLEPADVDKTLQLSPGGLGLGAIDWLSDERRRDYNTWQAEVLERIQNMENPRKAKHVRVT